MINFSKCSKNNSQIIKWIYFNSKGLKLGEQFKKKHDYVDVTESYFLQDIRNTITNKQRQVHIITVYIMPSISKGEWRKLSNTISHKMWTKFLQSIGNSAFIFWTVKLDTSDEKIPLILSLHYFEKLFDYIRNIDKAHIRKV